MAEAAVEVSVPTKKDTAQVSPASTAAVESPLVDETHYFPLHRMLPEFREMIISRMDLETMFTMKRTNSTMDNFVDKFIRPNDLKKHWMHLVAEDLSSPDDKYEEKKKSMRTYMEEKFPDVELEELPFGLEVDYEMDSEYEPDDYYDYPSENEGEWSTSEYEDWLEENDGDDYM